jgi:hypothetical protein
VPTVIVDTPVIFRSPGDTTEEGSSETTDAEESVAQDAVIQEAFSPVGKYYVVTVGKEVGIFSSRYVLYSFVCLLPLTSALVSMPPPLSTECPTTNIKG